MQEKKIVLSHAFVFNMNNYPYMLECPCNTHLYMQ